MNQKEIIRRVIEGETNSTLSFKGMGLTAHDLCHVFALIGSGIQDGFSRFLEAHSQPDYLYRARGYIDLSDNKISDMSFLEEMFAALPLRGSWVLDLSNNEIDEVDGVIGRFYGVSLADNRLTNESFSGISFRRTLKKINVSGNFIENPENLKKQFSSQEISGLQFQKVDPAKLHAEMMSSNQEAAKRFAELQQSQMEQIAFLGETLGYHQEQMFSLSQGLVSMNEVFKSMMDSSQKAILAQNEHLKQINASMLNMAESQQQVSSSLFEGLQSLRSQAFWGILTSIVVTIAGFIFYWWLG